MIDKLEFTQRLLFRAQNDLRSAEDLLKTERPATDVICFHCQQAAEKMLKAWVQWHDIQAPRTHNLTEILELCRRIDPAFGQLESIDVLTPYAVEVRYADDFYQPTLREAKIAAADAKRVERFVITKFQGLGVEAIKDFSDGPVG